MPKLQSLPFAPRNSGKNSENPLHPSRLESPKLDEMSQLLAHAQDSLSLHRGRRGQPTMKPEVEIDLVIPIRHNILTHAVRPKQNLGQR